LARGCDGHKGRDSQQHRENGVDDYLSFAQIVVKVAAQSFFDHIRLRFKSKTVSIVRHRHDFYHFIDEPPQIAQGGKGVVVPGCPACRKRFYTMPKWLKSCRRISCCKALSNSDFFTSGSMRLSAEETGITSLQDKNTLGEAFTISVETHPP
jgi:hypothetical protein